MVPMALELLESLEKNLPPVLTPLMFLFPVLLAVNAVMLRLKLKPKLTPLSSMVDTTVTPVLTTDSLTDTDMVWEDTMADTLDTTDTPMPTMVPMVLESNLPLVSMPPMFPFPVLNLLEKLILPKKNVKKTPFWPEIKKN